MAKVTEEECDAVLCFLKAIPLGGDPSKVTSETVASHFEWDHQKAVGCVRKLQGQDVLDGELVDRTEWTLTDEGEIYRDLGTPEVLVSTFVQRNQPTSRETITRTISKETGLKEDMVALGISHSLKCKWIKMNPEKLYISLVVPERDEVLDCLRAIHADGEETQVVKAMGTDVQTPQLLQALKKRKLVNFKSVKYYKISKGKEYDAERKPKLLDLTQQMILDGTWKDFEIKAYNFIAAGRRTQKGSTHALVRVMKKFRRVLFSMGFEEMPTSKWVESSFWNFDSLFVPQQHPARDSHDTFFLTEPKSSNVEMLPGDYVDRVRNAHEVGGYGSIGYGYTWSKEETSKNVLRTHTTAVSSQMLYKLGQDYQKTKVFTPKRYFSIDRVFRNESLDATHLAEFHQVEGLAADYNLSLGDLMGVMRTFYKKIGITDLKSYLLSYRCSVSYRLVGSNLRTIPTLSPPWKYLAITQS
eukprot:GHVN01089321.1.p1 GENE.GHVN01089321.1~~GHVN01089321.1.p1  ORF type:complete len:470 (+),score=48.51 GHVN01089321.1:2015-3424(+)